MLVSKNVVSLLFQSRKRQFGRLQAICLGYDGDWTRAVCSHDSKTLARPSLALFRLA